MNECIPALWKTTAASDMFHKSQPIFLKIRNLPIQSQRNKLGVASVNKWGGEDSGQCDGPWPRSAAAKASGMIPSHMPEKIPTFLTPGYCKRPQTVLRHGFPKSTLIFMSQLPLSKPLPLIFFTEATLRNPFILLKQYTDFLKRNRGTVHCDYPSFTKLGTDIAFCISPLSS